MSHSQKKFTRKAVNSKKKQVKSQSRQADIEVNGRLTDKRSLSAYKERLHIAHSIRTGKHTSYKPPVKMTKEEFLKSIS